MAVDLEQFSIYRPHQRVEHRRSKFFSPSVEEKARSNELVSLNELNEKGNDTFLLDGVLRYGDCKKYVCKVSFQILSIGEYENLDSSTVGESVWIQSLAGKGSGVWYCLRSPAEEYSRFHKPFLWLADLSKHVVDFLDNHPAVRLVDFRYDFYQWLCEHHRNDKIFSGWLDEYNNNTDFRQAVAAHATFLFNQAGVLDSNHTLHPFWEEICPWSLIAVPRQPDTSKKTVVTPFVFECFRHLPWSKFLCPLESTCLPPSPLILNSKRSFLSSKQGPVNTGDVVAIRSDPDTDWKSGDDLWYGYVQGITTAKCKPQLSLLWLYRPSDTACLDQRYPFAKELFLSDHCNCGDKAIYVSEVVSKLSVNFFGDPNSAQDQEIDFFVRQKYVGDDSAWISLEPSDFRCSCRRKVTRMGYRSGDTVLVSFPQNQHVLEPAVILEDVQGDTKAEILVRILLRRRRDFEHQEDAEPNELVFTDQSKRIRFSSIFRRCHIRFYTVEDKTNGRIPAPYNRKGTADCFFIIYRSTSNTLKPLEPMERPDPLINQGFDPLFQPQNTLRGLDIFCGGGNLGRGLEEGGAVKFEWAVDWFGEAIHTYKANLNTIDGTKLFFGSVNDYLTRASKAKDIDLIAQRGEVDFISAGFSCQGVSVLNFHYKNDKSLINASMVALAVAFIDFYRPRYAILENVLGIANTGPKRGEQNVFAQVLCSLVALGYQVRPHILDSWNFGAPQARTRLFVSIAAPGLAPLTQPPASHSHPRDIINRSIGKTANGLPFGPREWNPTPLKYVTIGEATADLPENPDARTACIAYPDHRASIRIPALDQIRLSNVPRFPPGMNFVKSAKLGWQSVPQIAKWHWDSALRSQTCVRAWERANANALLSTVTTVCGPGDATTGAFVHWDAHRPLTVMEARRAQGVPDHEVIIGAPAMQWKIIGNSVTRQVATAWGVALRFAWLNDVRQDARDDLDASDFEDELLPETSALKTESQSRRRCRVSVSDEFTLGSGDSSLPSKESLGQSPCPLSDSSDLIVPSAKRRKLLNASVSGRLYKNNIYPHSTDRALKTIRSVIPETESISL